MAMRTPEQMLLRSVLLVLIPTLAFAGGVHRSASPKPQGESKTVKVWTNEDLEALGPRVEPANEPAPPTTEPPAVVVELESPPVLPPEKDPRWYARQLAALDDQLASVSAQEDQLLHFRETDNGLPTGLNVVAPCHGITTDNRIADLEARRLEILQQLDNLADTARVNDMPPGILVEGRGLASAETPLSPRQREAQLVDRYEGLTASLGRTEETLARMQEDADLHHQTLLQPDSRWGGNLTTNLLQDLYERRSDLEDQINATEDQMKGFGITPP
jgi:hypothetical protein